MTNNGEGLFGVGATSSPASRMAYGGADVYKSVNRPDASPPDQQQQQPMMVKKKRGRPRKYTGVTDGTMSLALMPAAIATPPSRDARGGAFSSPTPLFKRARGRPPGSTNKKTKNNSNIDKHQQHFQPPLLGGFGLTPHVISVKAGEDVSSKIMSFSQNGPRAVCILSANGVISNVTLRQAATSGGTATYEGRFEILSLCGSFLLTEIGGLSVSLAGPDGRVLGGSVAGLLTAASPVQVIVGSFIPECGRKESKVEASNGISSPLPQNPMPMPMQPMQGGSGNGSESSLNDSFGGESSSPPNNHSTGGTNQHNNNNINQPQGLMGMPWRWWSRLRARIYTYVYLK